MFGIRSQGFIANHIPFPVIGHEISISHVLLAGCILASGANQTRCFPLLSINFNVTTARFFNSIFPLY